MANDLYIGVNGKRLTAVKLTVSNGGPWIADVDFESDPDVEGRVELTIGDGLKLSGTVVARSSGTYGLQRRARIVAGAGGWSAEVPPKQYHNDAGVKAVLVAEDAARAVGEQLGGFVPAAERVGRDYVRERGPASRALEDVLGGVVWWVDYAGLTHAGTRPPVPLEPKAYTVLAYDPRDRIATLAMDDPGLMKIGSILAADGPQIVRSFEVRVTADEARVMAWCAGSSTGTGYLAGLLRSIVERTTDGALHGHYRYRLVRMAGDRLELQAVRKVAGLPDLLPISVMPGIAGAHAVLTPGTEVLVAFVEGDRAQPVALAFAGKDGPGFQPVTLFLGGPTGAPAARQGDIVECQLPPASFTGLIGGVQSAGLLTFTPSKALGVITGGSSKVKVSS
jgi:hypothetical protein